MTELESTPTSSARSSIRRRWSLDDELVEFLRSPENRRDFKLFLVQRFSSENILFYEDCEARRVMPDAQGRIAKALAIISDFLIDGAHLQINIGRDNRAPFARAMDNDTLADPALFDVVEHIVLLQMEIEHWGEYLERNPSAMPASSSPTPL
jgi:hypothetical protein